ncbi:MAG: methyl-accepting chemotaxis protein [Gammaproteobacteria bacterium]|nr:methyl-accepting chemotaxis protein [Gammaproteobacteria bacterium]
MVLMFQSIRSKIIAGYAAVLLVAILSAVVLLNNNQQIRQRVDSFTGTTLPVLAQLDLLLSDSKELVLAGYSLYGTTLDSDSFIARQQQLELKLQQANQHLNRQLRVSLDRELSEFHQSLNNLGEVMAKSDVDWDLARERLTDLTRQAAVLAKALDQLRSEVAAEANAGSMAIAQQLSLSFVVIVSLISVLILVAVGAFMLAQRQIAVPIQQLSGQITQLAQQRDLTVQFNSLQQGELGQMSDSLTRLLQVFSAGMLDVRGAISRIGRAVNELSSSTDLSAHSVQNLQQDIVGLVDTMQQLEQQMSQSVEYSASAATYAEHGAKQLAQAQQQVTESSDSIYTLAKDIETTASMLLTLKIAGDQVSTVVKTIADIAAQTNLLALNAAIEAARAGESGRGFAVVADEVRTLATRTHQSTVEINQMLETIVRSIQSAVVTMGSNQQQAAQSVQLSLALVDTLKQSRAVILQLAEVSQQSAATASDAQQDVALIRQQVQQFRQLGDQVLAGNSQIGLAAQSMTELADQLSTTVSQFKTKG